MRNAKRSRMFDCFGGGLIEWSFVVSENEMDKAANEREVGGTWNLAPDNSSGHVQ